MKTYRATLFGLATGAVLALAAPAAIADGNQGSVKDVDCCAYNWGGFYVGVSAGWQRSDINGTFVDVPGSGYNTEHDSFILGGIIGVQRQWGKVVLGLEANWSAAALDENWGTSRGPSSDCLVADRTCHGRLEYLFTVGPRVGWAANNWLFYATGGYAQGSLATQSLVTSNPGALITRTKAPHDGWFLGGGVEWAVSKNVVLGLEYQRVTLDTERHDAFTATNAAAAPPIFPNDRDMTADVDVVRARLTFKLDRDTARPLK